MKIFGPFADNPILLVTHDGKRYQIDCISSQRKRAAATQLAKKAAAIVKNPELRSIAEDKIRAKILTGAPHRQYALKRDGRRIYTGTLAECEAAIRRQA